jgi:hypothetical protein
VNLQGEVIGARFLFDESALIDFNASGYYLQAARFDPNQGHSPNEKLTMCCVTPAGVNTSSKCSSNTSSTEQRHPRWVRELAQWLQPPHLPRFEFWRLGGLAK